MAHSARSTGGSSHGSGASVVIIDRVAFHPGVIRLATDVTQARSATFRMSVNQSIDY